MRHGGAGDGAQTITISSVFARRTPLTPSCISSTIRREERALIAWYRNLVEEVLEHATPGTLDLAIEIVSLPDQIRGYEGIKRASIRAVKELAAEKLAVVKQAPQVIV